MNREPGAFKRAILIYNPAARRLLRGRAAKLQQIEKALSAAGIAVEMAATERSLHAAQLAREAVKAQPDLIIACGGDGTVNEIISGMAKSHIPLLVLPGGTANVLAKDVGIPKDFRRSIQLTHTGIIRRIALGKVKDRYFVCMAGVGVDAGIVAAVNSDLKRKLGEGAFWVAGFKQLFAYAFPSFQLVIDGQTHTGTFAVIARARSYGGPLSIAPHADLFSSRFDICLYTGSSRWSYLRYCLFTLLGKHLSLSDVTYLQATQVEAGGNSEVWYQLDGELAGKLPQKFSIETDALSLIVPDTAAASS
jgi:diacylglycerol kinase (ATP)